MIKKVIAVFLITLSLVGCTNKSVTKNENNEQQNTVKDVNYFSKNTDELIGKDVNYLFDKLDKPNIVTYYVDNKEINFVDITDFDKKEEINKMPIVKEFIYRETEDEKNAVYVYAQKDKINEVKVKEFLEIPKNEYKNTEYIINYYNNSKAIDYDNFNVEKTKSELMGKNIDEFNKNYNLKYGNIEAFKKSTKEQISLYKINDYDKSVIVYSRDKIVKEIIEVEQKLSQDIINNYFGR